MFCRVRPLLPGELSSTGLDDSTASTDTGSQTAVKADQGNLHIEYPDKEGDCRKISIHFFPYQVKCCSLQCTCMSISLINLMMETHIQTCQVCIPEPSDYLLDILATEPWVRIDVSISKPNPDNDLVPQAWHTTKCAIF